jgi:hypothetical protein
MPGTAIIVSGALRELDNASPSWRFTGDLHLFTQRQYQPARTVTAQHDITGELANYTAYFSSVTVVDQLEITHPNVNMAWKWQLAYQKLSALGYDKFIIIRPDLYFINLKDISELDFKPQVLYTTSDIVQDPMGYDFINDTWLAGDIGVFKIISDFYQYYLQRYTHSNVHHTLSQYIRDSGVSIDPRLAEYASTLVLRPVHRNMLHKGQLLDKYTVNDLFSKGWEWNNGTGYQND